MLRFIASRLLQMIPVLLVIAVLTFTMIRLAPGGPFSSEKNIPAEIQKNLDAYYGLDLPVHRQFLRWFSNAVRGDLGPSTRYSSRTVNELIAESFPISAELAGWSLLVAITIGLFSGIIASIHRNTAADYIPSSLALVGISIPNFVLGPLLVLVFALHFGRFRVFGWDQPIDRVLPALTLGAAYAAYIARLARGGMVEILSEDFIRTARAKGASETRVILKHALRGGLIPVISYLGPTAAALLTGSFVVETIFQIPGLGRNFVNAAFNRDYTMVLGCVLFYAALIVLFNLIVDLVVIWMNPRLKFE
ncbi:MAG: ABC transporter permease [Verrucomicrobiota bacterium]|nr:ABC transporter permease [Verrucomicrobiota bacterium]